MDKQGVNSEHREDDVGVTSDMKLESKHEAAVPGHAATDKYGQPTIVVDVVAERRLRRKIDRYVAINVFVIYLLCFIDRVNIGNARLAGFEEELNMQGWDYNITLCIFFVAYIVFEFPCTFLCKIIGPGWFLPGATVLFGLFTLAMGFVQSKGAAYAVRFLLGVAEAGMMPGIAYYLSRWYRRHEIVLRISFYMVAGPLAGAFGGLLASGILSLDSVGSLRRWRMIFAVEGIITMGVGLLAFFTITNSPESARWLDQDEKDLAVSRLKSERLTTTELVDRWNSQKMLRGIFSPVQFLNMVIFLMVGISVQGIAVFLPTIVTTIYPDSSVVQRQLHTVPPYIVGAATVLFLPWVSTRIRQRQIFLILASPICVVGYAMFVGTPLSQTSTRYAATFLVAGAVMPLGIFCNAQAAANSLSDSSRNAAIAATNFGGNIGGLIAMWTYLPADAPAYKIGAGINLCTSACIFLLALAGLVFMKRDNARREGLDVDAELAGLSPAEIENLDWKHPAFRWSV